MYRIRARARLPSSVMPQLPLDRQVPSFLTTRCAAVPRAWVHPVQVGSGSFRPRGGRDAAPAGGVRERQVLPDDAVAACRPCNSWYAQARRPADLVSPVLLGIHPSGADLVGVNPRSTAQAVRGARFRSRRKVSPAWRARPMRQSGRNRFAGRSEGRLPTVHRGNDCTDCTGVSPSPFHRRPSPRASVPPDCPYAPVLRLARCSDTALHRSAEVGRELHASRPRRRAPSTEARLLASLAPCARTIDGARRLFGP